MWVVAVVLMLAEFLVFDRMTSEHYTKIYPRWDDQVSYLNQAYGTYENAQAHGFLYSLRHAFTDLAPQGVLHRVMACFVFAVTGEPSRSAALSLNMLAFLAWQAAVLFAFARTGGGWTLGWMIFGLLPCLFRPWCEEAGAATDFRLDHAAMCLFGVSAAVTLLTRGFRSTGWSVGLGLVLAVTMVERFLTSVYLVPLFLLSAGWILGGPDKWPRMRNLLLSGLVAALLAGPVFWLQRAIIYEYYWVGQVSGAEAAARIPGYTALQSIEYIYFNFRYQQLGPWFVRNGVILTLALLVPALLSFRLLRAKVTTRVDWDWLFYGLAFFLVPALVLFLHRQKSNVVLGILVPGLVLLIGWIWSILWPRALALTQSHALTRLLPAGLAVASVYLGGTFFLDRQRWQPHDAAFRADAARINQLTDYFFERSRAANRPAVRLGVDRVSEALNAQVMQVVCYERNGVWLLWQGFLPTGILEEKDEVVMERLGACDFVVLTDQPAGPDRWPSDRQMRRLYPTLKAWCENNLKRVENFTLFGQQMSLYQSRDIP